MTDYTVMDLIKFSADQKPIDFEQAFNDILVDRMQSAVADKKLAVAQTMFNPQFEEGNDSDDYEQEDTEDQSDGETA